MKRLCLKLWPGWPNGKGICLRSKSFPVRVRGRAPIMAFLFNIEIDAPIWEWDSLWSKDFGIIAENKSLEMQLMRDNILLKLEINIRFTGRDHAGPELSIGLLGFVFDIRVYDHRHWNHEKNEWETYEQTNN